jgi:pre-mRNA-splicing factor SYF2/beta-D-xylosidase 4
VRDPRWGRNIESAGEDPFLSGEYAVNFVQGFEHAKEATFPLQSSACCKHFVANELDNSNGTDRDHVNSIVPEQDLVDSYLPSFQACVEEGKVSGIMCSYNAVNGVPSCASDWLLGTLLRESWQFDGYVTSDCDADADVFNTHHYTPTPELAVQAVLRAGTDVDCGNFVPTHAASALANGDITTADIDTVLKRLFKVRIKLGQFDPPTALNRIGAESVCSDYARELARDGVRQSVVLAKNAGGALPLDAGKYANVVVIGPNLDSQQDNGYYGGRPCDNAHTTFLDAIKQHVPGATGIKGVPSVSSGDTSGVAAAAAAASAADLVFLAVGSDLELEAEGHDRTSIDFSDAQKALITAVATAAKGPVVALIQSGGAMDVSALLANPGIAAILICGHASVQIVGAGDVVFGKTLDGRAVAPAGRMSQMTCASRRPRRPRRPCRPRRPLLRP